MIVKLVNWKILQSKPQCHANAVHYVIELVVPTEIWKSNTTRQYGPLIARPL